MLPYQSSLSQRKKASEVDNPETIELAEIQLDQFINLAHKSGLPYWHILRVLLSRLETLVMQSDVEFLMKQ